MYDESDYFDPHDPHHMPGGGIGGVDGASSQTATNCSPLPLMVGTSSNNRLEDNIRLSNFSIEDLSQPNPSSAAEAAAGMGLDLQNQLGFDLEQEFNCHLMHDMPLDQPNWDESIQEMQEIENYHRHQHQHQHQQQYEEQQQISLQQNLNCFNSNPFANPGAYNPPDLLNLLHLPRCAVTSMLPNSSISFDNSDKKTENFHTSLDIFSELPKADATSAAAASTVLYDPPIHLNFPPQPPLFRELFHSLPHTYGLSGTRSGSFFGGVDDGEGPTGVFQEDDGRQFENSVLDFRREMNGLSKRQIKGTSHFTTERQRREQFSDKFQALKALVPNPTKPDRASIVGDAIEYVKELQRRVDELKILVEKKRCGRERSKRVKTEDEAGAAADMESSSMKPLGEQSLNGSLRSSWLTRKSKETEVDVRIIDDEVNIKLTQRKKMNCLLFVSKILDELQLDLLHASGGNIGDYYIFMFNTKIYEGSFVYASAIAKKFIEVLDRQNSAFPGSF